MANTVNYASMYMNMLDRIFQEASTTSLMTAKPKDVKFDNVDEKTLYLKKISINGLGDYSRTNGYVDGDSTVEWESHSFTQDRGRRFNFDAMDSMEAKTTIAELMAEAMRTKIIPEIDTYRYTKLYSLAGGSNADATLTHDTVVNAIDTGTSALNDLEVWKERLLFISSGCYQTLKESSDTFKSRLVTGQSASINRNILMFDEMPVIQVPQGRFNSAATFYDGSSVGETAGGYTTTGYDLNFMILPLGIAQGVIKHFKPKIISPDANQSADSWLFAYRLYHDIFVADNKVNGIYIHRKSA